MNKITYGRLFLFFFFLFFTCSLSAQYPKREMRGVWIATVSNIDWPSSPQLSSEQQRNELISILDALAENNINAVIVQIRPTADAFYHSYYEPWSHWLTGTQGVKPHPFYDPLEFITDEAHKRFMDVHVWINPYRVTATDKSNLYAEHLFYKNQQLRYKYTKVQGDFYTEKYFIR